MFNESPFNGACVYATYEVLVMLIGTFVLGVLLGYLIWGWLKRKVVALEKKADKYKSVSHALQAKVAGMTTRINTLTENYEKAETKLSLAEFRQRRAQEEAAALKAELETAHQKFVEQHPDPDLNEEPSLIPPGDEPSLADISHAMESPLDPVEMQPHPEEHHDPGQASLSRGSTPESLAIAEQIFGTRILPNDLKTVRGIGPKIEEILHRAGITTWVLLAETRLPELRRVMEEAGPRYRLFDPKTWPLQARMAARGEWKKLKAYQDTLGETEE